MFFYNLKKINIYLIKHSWYNYKKRGEIMVLYLSSYKLGNRIDVLKKWIEKNNNKILLIPNARDAKEKTKEEKRIIESDKKSLEDIGFSVTILDLKKYFNREEELKTYIKKQYNAVYVLGGNTFVLRQAMKLSGLDKYIIENKNNDFLYAGYSAGICVLARSLDGIELVDKKINPYNLDEVISDGIRIDRLFNRTTL